MYHPFLKLSASLPLSTEYSADFTKKGKKIIKDIFSGEIPHNLAYDAITQSYNQKEITPELWGIANDDGTGMGIASLVRTSLREDYDRLRFLTQKTPLQIRLIDKNSEDGKTLESEKELWNDNAQYYASLGIANIPLVADSVKKVQKHDDSPETSEKRGITFLPASEGSSLQP